MLNDADIDLLADVFGEFIARLRAERQQELKALEARLRVVEKRPVGLSYEGVWTSGTEYTKGCFVTDKGSLWACVEDTSKRPGGGERAWRLAAKRGADGKAPS
jgi:hypothetical protein